MRKKLKINSECFFSNKRLPGDISYRYYSGKNNFVNIIIQLNKITIFSIDSSWFKDFIFYTDKDNII